MSVAMFTALEPTTHMLCIFMYMYSLVIVHCSFETLGVSSSLNIYVYALVDICYMYRMVR